MGTGGGGLAQGFFQWRTGRGPSSVSNWHRFLFSGGLEQGIFQWRTGAGFCSVGDWYRFLFSGGLERAFFSGGLLEGLGQ